MAKELKWRLVAESDPISQSILFITRGFVSHVEFLSEDEKLCFGARATGVKWRPINYCKFSVDIRFRIPCSDAQYEKVWDFLQEQQGKGYDYLAIGGILVHRDWRNDRRWWCSELWATALEVGGLIGKINESIAFFTPEDALIISSAMWPQP